MNGYPSLDSPTNCANCGHPFQMSADGTHYEAWRSPDGKFILQNSAPRAQMKPSWLSNLSARQLILRSNA
jgi:hypothetical protein